MAFGHPGYDSRMADRRGVFPGSFDPPTIAHLAIAEAAVSTHVLDTVTFCLSADPLGKSHVDQATLVDRVTVLELESTRRPWLRVETTHRRLLADIASGYDVLIVGADKWEQLHELDFYDGDPIKRDAALARLPIVAVAPRPPHAAPERLMLKIDPALGLVSSSAARAGRVDHLTPQTAEYARDVARWPGNGTGNSR